MAYTQEQLNAIVAAIVGGLGTSGNKSSTSTTKQAIKLTNVSAKQLLDSIARDIQFTGKFTTAELNQFVEAYNKTANEQLETVVRAARDQVKPGEDIQSTVSSLLTTTFPTFFDPKQFTQDYIWKKVNFGNEAELGAKSLEALQTARQIAKDFNLSGFSEVELLASAKKIARGELTEDQFKAQLAQIAKIEYPQLAGRFDSTPGGTTRQFYLPILKAVADTWEVDVNTLDINDPFIDSLIRPDGVIGKVPAKSVGQAKQAAMNHPKFDESPTAIKTAGSAAAEFARALGWGI
jgi:hypothetical protein